MESVVKVRVALCGVLFMFLGLFSSNSPARGLDYNAMVTHSFNLSGKVVSFSLPGGLDRDFPVNPGIAVANIYDEEKYHGPYYRPALLERHWDYRGYFWQGLAGRYAMMGMRFTVQRLPEHEFPNIAVDMPGFERKIIQRVYSEYEKAFDGEFSIIVNCDNLMVGEIPALKCSLKDSTWPANYYFFHIPLRDQFYLIFSFTLTPVGDNKSENRHKWYPQSLKDVDKIIASVNISK